MQLRGLNEMSDFMNDVKISVIVPIFNAEKYLDSCINSVLEQTYSNWELILIDDGSTDKSGIIADEYKRRDTRIHVIHQENAGVSSARNRGLDVASGDYISFLDADDEFTPDCLEKLMNAAIRSNVDIVAAKYCGEVSSNIINAQDSIWRGEDALKHSLMDDPFTYLACTKLFRRSIIGETRFSSELRVSEDTYFLFHLLCKRPSFLPIQEEVYIYKHNPDSVTRAAFSERHFDVLRACELKYELIQKQFPEMLELAKNMQLKACMCLLRVLAVRTKNEYRNKEKELLRWVDANKNSYISATSSDDKWMFILKHHMYYVYKAAKHLQRAIRH